MKKGESGGWWEKGEKGEGKTNDRGKGTEDHASYFLKQRYVIADTQELRG